MGIAFNMITICIIFILAISLIKVIRHYKTRSLVEKEMYKRLNHSFKEVNTQKKQLEQREKNASISLQNLSNALEYKKLHDGKRNVFVRKIKEDQIIVIFLDEEYHYSIDYFDQKSFSDKESFIASRDINCTVFIDGKIYDPLLMTPIFKGDNRAEIKDINCGMYQGRGLGTCLIQCLEETLKAISISRLEAGLSWVDFERKDKLYNFYLNKNNFKIISEVQKNKWGRVEKKLLV